MNTGLIKKITKTSEDEKIQIKLDSQIKINDKTYNVFVYLSEKDGILPVLMDESTDIQVGKEFGDIFPLLNKKCDFDVDFEEIIKDIKAVPGNQEDPDAKFVYFGKVVIKESICLNSISVTADNQKDA